MLRALVALLVAVTLAAAGNENLATADGGTLRRSGINAPVIFITAHDEPSAREQVHGATSACSIRGPEELGAGLDLREHRAGAVLF